MLARMEVFYYVATLNSFSKAAATLGLSKGYVSMLITELEKELQVKLLVRTTRHISLTDKGKIFLNSCDKIVKEQSLAKATLEGLKAEPAGLLKISAPPSFCEFLLSDIVVRFVEQYPKIQIEIDSAAKIKDLFQKKIDIAFRITKIPDENYIARLLTQFRSIVCVSANYPIDNYKHPRELTKHNCLIYSSDPQGTVWPFEKNSYVEDIEVSGNIITNQYTILLDAVKKGVGIARLPEYIVKKDLIDGSLIEIYKDYNQKRIPIYAIYPSLLYGSAKVEKFLSFMKQTKFE